MFIVKQVEIKTSHDGKKYWSLPVLKSDEFYAAKLKNGGFIHPGNKKPYISKDSLFYLSFDTGLHDLVIVKQESQEELSLA